MANWKWCNYSKDITRDIVLTMSHWLFAKFLSFMVDLKDGIRVIEVHTHIGLNHIGLRKHNES